MRSLAECEGETVLQLQPCASWTRTHLLLLAPQDAIDQTKERILKSVQEGYLQSDDGAGGVEHGASVLVLMVLPKFLSIFPFWRAGPALV